MFNFRAITHLLGLLIAISGLAMLLAIPFSLYYQSSDLEALLYSGLGSLVLGGAIWFFTRSEESQELKKRDGYLIVTMGWLVMSLIGSVPYMLSGAIPSFADAFFETMSGFTTTGASILGQHIEELPKGLHFWRAMTHWIGGMGIIVLTIAILPLLGIGGMQLYAAEVPGPTPDKLTPRVKETAKRLWIIYVALTAIEAIFLMFGGMNFFDSICHSMATLSTGGFSTRQASMAAFSPYHQYIVTLFMFLAGTNFALTYFALRGKPLKLWENEEFRIYLFVTLILTAVVTGVVFATQDIPFEQAFRESIFQILAVITTTGFGTADFTAWGPFLMVLFFFLMFCGACAGSTSGGMKLVRFIVVFKNSYLELKRQIFPKAILPVRFNGKSISEDIVGKIVAFFLIFVLIFVAGSFVMAAMGLDYMSALGSVAATLGNIGPGIGAVGPGDPENFAALPDAGKWFLSFLMLLGRLELFTVLMIFTPFFWKSR
ncbi:potassium transporter TrkG [Pontibacter sp. G13]|uniref:TrkH family potassium uptake protein n=1 Tax=Pontibacter sp. G13 TaxID=3074898 RepID=UPI00288BBBB5|nr:potassium transporter TrkG [Pontibacter sp. G13]WNJ18536.1 potassium transporter TrkG [Pontibacter sp. G13]